MNTRLFVKSRGFNLHKFEDKLEDNSISFIRHSHPIGAVYEFPERNGKNVVNQAKRILDSLKKK